MSENPLELISEIDDLMELHGFMEDEQLDRAMYLVVKLLNKPDISPVQAPKVIVELQALATKFTLSAALYKTFKRDKAGSENNFRKEVYYSVSDALNRLVDSLKYTARYGVER